MEPSIGKVDSSHIIVFHQLKGWLDQLRWLISKVKKRVILHIRLYKTEVELIAHWTVTLLVERKDFLSDGDVEVKFMTDDA